MSSGLLTEPGERGGERDVIGRPARQPRQRGRPARIGCRARPGGNRTGRALPGRPDQAEFDERVGAALRARTRNDLSGLLSDLPRRGPLATGAVATSAVATGRPGWPAPWLPL